MKPQECCVLIPSLSPDERLPAYVKDLLAADFQLSLVVDDGSKEEYQPIFDEIAGWERCHVLHHEVNRGKGAALRTGFAYIKEHTAIEGIITADSDGQHTVPDTLNLAAEMSEKEELLLGSRDFSRNSVQVPPKSRAGNRITSCVFRVLYGRWLPDTQTGLRAFRRSLIDFMLGVTGDRFEYEMNQLIHCAVKKVPMRPLPIDTVYHDENKGTHFHPIRDSWRIYKLLLGNFFKFISASCVSTIVDLLLFTLLGLLITFLPANAPFFGTTLDLNTLVCAIVARICSATVNFKLNQSFVFHLKKSSGAAWRYIILCGVVMIASALSTSVLKTLLPFIHPTLIKGVVDMILFFLNYRVQRAWVFPPENAASA